MRRRPPPMARIASERTYVVRARRHATGATLNVMETAETALRCLRCDSAETMVPNVEVVTYPETGSTARSLELIYDQKPDALLFKERLHAGVTATVCCSCGHVELMINRADRQSLWSATQARKQR